MLWTLWLVRLGLADRLGWSDRQVFGLVVWEVVWFWWYWGVPVFESVEQVQSWFLLKCVSLFVRQ